MALKPSLNLSQSQNLSLTPQLMASIKMLQLSYIELAEFVENELEQNPLLERDEKDSEENKNKDIEFEQNHLKTQTLDSAKNIADDFDTDVANIYPEQVGQDSISQSTSLMNSTSPNHGESADIDSYVAAKLTLSDHLWEQVVLILDEPSQRLIARFLIDSLDESGYLSSDILSIANQLGTEESHILDILKKLQGCEPIGVFCRNLSECLAIQLKALDRFDPMMAGLLDNLDLVMKHDFILLGKTINASSEDIKDMLAELRDLNPKPGQVFDVSSAQTIVADVFVKQGNDNNWLIELNSETLPRVLVNRTYFAKIKQKIKDKGEKAYLVDCLQSANWLTKSLDQRAKTILKVASEIVNFQGDFLKHGISHLKPMTLKMVASEIEMHESTISRVTTNKYISTPRGLFEMKYFFTSALSSSTGVSEHSSETVRFWIKQLIDEEKIKAILSDESISKILKEKFGADVARRTVMKYRENMKIASSVIRRRQKKALLLE